MKCLVDGCDREARKLNFCTMHYQRHKRHGDPTFKQSAKMCSVDCCENVVDSHGYCGKHWARIRRHGDPNYVPQEKKDKKCAVDGCDKKAIAKGYCNNHYQNSEHYKSIRRSKVECHVDGCNLPSLKNGLCSTHYQRLRKTGSFELNKIPTSQWILDNVVNRPASNDCWLNWPYMVNTSGYPMSIHNGKLRPVSNTVLEIMEVHRPPGKTMVMHHCDNPLCINPSHLSWGTAKENSVDMVTKGRHPIGSASSVSKLDENLVYQIRCDHVHLRQSVSSLARKYSVSRSTINALLKKGTKMPRTWRHVPYP